MKEIANDSKSRRSSRKSSHSKGKDSDSKSQKSRKSTHSKGNDCDSKRKKSQHSSKKDEKSTKSDKRGEKLQYKQYCNNHNEQILMLCTYPNCQ